MKAIFTNSVYHFHTFSSSCKGWNSTEKCSYMFTQVHKKVFHLSLLKYIQNKKAYFLKSISLIRIIFISYLCRQIKILKHGK